MDNLVAELRAIEPSTVWPDDIHSRAADEIERQAARISELERAGMPVVLEGIRTQSALIERLTAERDEAQKLAKFEIAHRHEAWAERDRLMEYGNLRQMREIDRLRAALEGVTECEDLDTALVIARKALAGASDSQQRADISDGKA